MNATERTLRDQDMAMSQGIPEFTSVANALEGSKTKNQIPLLDGLRAIACLAVLSVHISNVAGRVGIWGPWYNIHTVSGMLAYCAASVAYSGNSGVILFFILSGFLLFLPYAKALLFDSPWPSFGRFYIRRFFRILPGYYTVVFLLMLFLQPEFLQFRYWYDVWLFLTFRSDGRLNAILNPPFWTLAIEFQFYLALPIIVWLFSLVVRRGPLRWRMLKLTSCLFLMILWGLLTKFWGSNIAYTSQPNSLFNRIFLGLKLFIYGNGGNYYEVFAIGMLICMVYTYRQYAPSTESWCIRIGRLGPLLFTAGLTLLFFLSLWNFYYQDTILYPRPYPVFTFLDPRIPAILSPYWGQWQPLGAALGYGCCMLALLYSSSRIKRPFEWSVLRWIASISFSLYMWHFQFLNLFKIAIFPAIQRQGLGHLVQFGALCCWTLVVIIPTSAMLYQWIERPGIRMGEWLVRKLENMSRQGHN